MHLLRPPACSARPVVTCRPPHPEVGVSLPPASWHRPANKQGRSSLCIRPALEQDVQGIVAAVATFASPVLVAVAIIQRQAIASMSAELEKAKEQAAQHEADMKELQRQVSGLKKAADQSVFLEKKLDEAAKEQFKLERALEMKDGQLESFMVVAQRQIKMLEERCDMLSRGLKP